MNIKNQNRCRKSCIVDKDQSNASLLIEEMEVVVVGETSPIPPMQQCQQPELSIQICRTSDHYSSFSSGSGKNNPNRLGEENATKPNYAVHLI